MHCDGMLRLYYSMSIDIFGFMNSPKTGGNSAFTKKRPRETSTRIAPAFRRRAWHKPSTFKLSACRDQTRGMSSGWGKRERCVRSIWTTFDPWTMISTEPYSKSARARKMRRTISASSELEARSLGMILAGCSMKSIFWDNEVLLKIFQFFLLSPLILRSD